MKDKISFITNAITDTQATIRAIDTKLGAITALSLLPFSVVGKIWANIGQISTNTSPWLGCSLGLLFFVVWFTSLFILIKTISAIDDPKIHIKDVNQAKGTFYSGGLFKFGYKDYFLCSSSIESDRSVEEQLASYPNTEAEIAKELSFEHLKLVYIRDIKSHRLRGALITIMLWAGLGISIFGSSIFL
jgi:hypothetical protein